MANIFSDFWYRINKKLVPRNSKVTETSSDFIVELQNANNDKPADRETLVSFSIPKGTSFTPQDRQQVNAALETFKNVSSISSDQWTALKDASKFENRLTTVEEDINGLEIGGRNLLRNRKGAKSSKAYGLTLDFLDNEFHIYGTCTSSGAAPFDLGGNLFSSGSLYEPGETYTLTSYPQLPVGVYIGNNTSNGSVDFMAGYLNSDKDEKSKTFTVASNSTGLGYLFAGIQPSKLEDGGKVDVTFRLKLERGNKATDWTPAPEDKADASALAKKADVSTLAEKADVSVILPSASVESSTTASQAYSVDSLIMVNGALRRVTSVIKKGDTISDSNSTVTTVSSELSRLSHQSTISEYSNVPHGELRLNINNNRTHQLYGTAIVRNDEWDSIWSNSVKCPGISDNNWYIKTNFKVWTPSKAYNVPCAGIFIGGISQYILPENFNNAIYYVGSDGYIYLQIGSSKPTTTYLWFFWGRVAEEGIA